VAVDPSLYCGYCYYCKRGRGNQCENWNAIGVSVTGGAASSCPRRWPTCQAAGSLAAKNAALIEPLSARSAASTCCSEHGRQLLIYGSGTMGLMMMELAKRAGAGTVSMVDLNPDRLETAKRLGCSAAVTNADELDAPRGWDIVIDCTGAEAAIRDVSPGRRGGTYLQFGVSAYDARVAIEPYEIYRREITITARWRCCTASTGPVHCWPVESSTRRSSSATGSR